MFTVLFFTGASLMAGQGQTCSNKEGLDDTKIVDCDGKGQTVQCPNNGMAPLSPRILTCGKLGSYNLDDQYRWPNNIICGGRYCTCACIVPDRIMLHITISLSLSQTLAVCPLTCLFMSSSLSVSMKEAAGHTFNAHASVLLLLISLSLPPSLSP